MYDFLMAFATNWFFYIFGIIGIVLAKKGSTAFSWVAFAIGTVISGISLIGNIISERTLSGSISSFSKLRIILLLITAILFAFLIAFLLKKANKKSIAEKNNQDNGDPSDALPSEFLHDFSDNPQYGLSVDCPVFIDQLADIKTYLDCLYSKNGDPLMFQYKKSVFSKTLNCLVDVYKAYQKDKKVYGTLFISAHGPKSLPKAPDGYQLSKKYYDLKNK